jgi:DNA polymerase-3 subunit beta
VRLSFGSGQVTIEAGTEGQARARETVPADFTGDQTVIAFSPHYLLDGLAAALTAALAPGPDEAAEPLIRLQFTSATRPALITGLKAPGGPEDHGQPADEPAPDYRYLVVPLRALVSA